jgi:two-component system cell cycle response regulator
MAILCVDDDPAARLLAARALRKIGLRIYQASNANSAIDMITRFPEIKLIVLDQHLPEGVQGFDILRNLKGDPSTHHIPVLMLSASADVEHMRQMAQELGASDFLSYPITDDALVMAAKKAMAAVTGQ